jgi:hypothetical protein
MNVLDNMNVLRKQQCKKIYDKFATTNLSVRYITYDTIEIQLYDGMIISIHCNSLQFPDDKFHMRRCDGVYPQNFLRVSSAIVEQYIEKAIETSRGG